MNHPMTTIRHTAQEFGAARADSGRSGITLTQLLGLIEKRSAQRRQRIALEGLDNRLRRDIGLPPRNEDTPDHSISMFGTYF